VTNLTVGICVAYLTPSGKFRAFPGQFGYCVSDFCYVLDSVFEIRTLPFTR